MTNTQNADKAVASPQADAPPQAVASPQVAPPQAAMEHIVDGEYDGQRLDNYLMRQWRDAPRRLIYRLIRTGQVRVNALRAGPERRLRGGDALRLPPHRPRWRAEKPTPTPLALPVLYEDAQLLVVSKPGGMAVHGGSGMSHGVIERLRAALPPHASLELAHRLDKETSGALLLTKKRSALRTVQEQWRRGEVDKQYTALVFGEWKEQHSRIRLPLKRIVDADGNRRVFVADDGKDSLTETRLRRQWKNGATLDAQLATGRTHQLRVHLAATGLSIVGDKKYGDFGANRAIGGAQTRMFLHAAVLSFVHPASGEYMEIVAPLPPEFARMEARLDGGMSHADGSPLDNGRQAAT